MSYTLGLDGVVLLTLELEKHPPGFKRSENHKKRSTLDDRAKIGFEGRNEMEQHTAKAGIDCAFNHAAAPAADVTYERNDAALTWREKLVNNSIWEWVRPCPVDD